MWEANKKKEHKNVKYEKGKGPTWPMIQMNVKEEKKAQQNMCTINMRAHE